MPADAQEMARRMAGALAHKITGWRTRAITDGSFCVSVEGLLEPTFTALVQAREALERIADRDAEWGDLDPYDGLHERSVRDFARVTLAAIAKLDEL